MYNLTKAIVTKAAGSSFLSSISSRFYNGRAPESSDYPYCTFLLPVTNDPQLMKTFTEDLEETTIQFSIFSAQKGPSEILTTYGYLISLYDDCSLTITGETHYWMQRINDNLISEEHTVKDGTVQVWAYHIDYSILRQT